MSRQSHNFGKAGKIAPRGEAMMDLARQLFPIHRTLINDGFDHSLALINDYLPIDVSRYPSGRRAWDWTIPNAWNVRHAFIETLDGARLVDFADSNLHLSAYSVAMNDVISHDELMNHIATLPDRPDAIPYNYLYYARGWQFNIAHGDLQRFNADRYRVVIDVDERPGTLAIGTCVLPGEVEDEVIVSTYLCHPSMANDNLSGVVAAVEFFRQLANVERRRLTYRLLIVPETIGAVTWLAHHEEILPRVRGAFVVYDCGDRAALMYKRSWFAKAAIDRAAEHAVRQVRCDYGAARIRPWHASGSDERQFNAPGVRIPCGAIMRSPAGEYDEYHTSLDTLDMLCPRALEGTVQALMQIHHVLEVDRVMTPTYRGEPCFSRHDIEYPSFHEDRGNEARLLVKKLVFEFDGRRSLLEIAEHLNEPVDRVASIAARFEEAGLIVEQSESMMGRSSLTELKHAKEMIKA